jgi:molybdate transport system ATP-binding protein
MTVQVSGKRLFQPMDWWIHTDQRWVVLGPNGSGKSILIRALCRNIPIIQGQIHYYFEKTLQGNYISRSHPKRGEIIVISPDTHQTFMKQYSIYHQARWHSFEGQEAPTVAELLSFESIGGLSPHDKTAIQLDERIFRERQQYAVDVLGIGHLWERKILHLSHGESRKVHLAQALIRSPQLMILDNPFVGLDNESREKLTRIIERLLSEPSPHLLFVTTEQNEIPHGITHGVFLENYQIKTIGEKNKVFSHVRNHLKKTSAWVKENSTPILPVFPLPRVAEPETKNPFWIELKNVSISYGSVHVLRNICWEMKKEEHWAILGPNGSGKTTLLSLLLADNPQSYANDITLFGIKRGTGESIWDIKKHIGWVSPELQIYTPFNMTCFHVVCSGFFHSTGLFRKCTLQQQGIAQKWMQSLPGSGYRISESFS